MPKIPTFETQARPTAQVGSVTSGIQISPTGGTAAALLPAAQAADDYFIKQRDNNEKLEAKKKFYEMKAESDKIMEDYKNNPDEFASIQGYKDQFGQYKNQQISQIKNKRVRKKLELLLDSDQAENIYKIKKNSFDAFEKEDTSLYNTEQTTLANAYNLETNSEIKAKKKQERVQSAIEFENKHQLGKSWLDKELGKIETDTVMLDVDKAIAGKNYGLAMKILKESDKSKVDSETLQKKIITIQKESAEYTETSFHVNNMLQGNNSTIGASYKSSSEKKVKAGLENVLFNAAGQNKLGPEQTFAYVDETFAKNGEVSPTYKNLMEAGYNTGSTTTFDSAADIPTTLVQAVKAAETADRLGRLNTYTTNEQERFYKNVIVAKKILGMDDYQAIKAAKDFETKYEASIIKGASTRRRKTLNQIEDKFNEVKATNIGDLRLYGEKLYNMYVVMGLDDNKAQKQVLEDIKNNITIVDDYAYLKRDIEAFKSIGSIGSVSPLKKYIVEQKLEEGEDLNDYYLRHNGGGQFELRRKLDTSPVYDKENNPTIYYAKDLKQLSTEQFKSFEEKERKETIEKQKRLQEARRETPDAVAP
jgi:hypothetical protein